MIDRFVKPLSEEQRAAVVQAARSYWNAPYRHQGRARHGIDCAGLLVAALRDIGVECRDVTGYGRMPYRQSLEAALTDNFGPMLDRSEMRVGDAALLRFDGDPSHIAVITDHPDRKFGMIHSFVQVKKVIEHGIDGAWMNRIVGVYRL